LGDLSHDSVNRFLLRERYEPKDLLRHHINLIGGILRDDAVIDKPYSDSRTKQINRILLVGLHHRIVKGLQLITLYYTELSGKSVPVNYRIYDDNASGGDHRMITSDEAAQ